MYFTETKIAQLKEIGDKLLASAKDGSGPLNIMEVATVIQVIQGAFLTEPKDFGGNTQTSV